MSSGKVSKVTGFRFRGITRLTNIWQKKSLNRLTIKKMDESSALYRFSKHYGGKTMLTYYAIFYRLEKGWGVRFPDAPSVHTSGKDLDEALFMAMDAISGLMVVGRKGREYQAPRPFDKIKVEAKEDELVFPVVPNEKIMEEYRPKKRINVMVPVDLLDKVGEVVKKTEGLDRSKFFCAAAEKYLSGVEGERHVHD